MNLKHEYFRSQNVRKSARGKDCTFRLPICNGDPRTTVFCHPNQGGGKGMSIKCDDFGAYGCSACHDAMDGGNEAAWSTIIQDKLYYWERATRETMTMVLLAVQKGEMKL